MKKTITFILFFCWLNFSFAQWSSNTTINTPVCTSTGKQIDVRITDDGFGGAFIAWKDFRAANGQPDIYVQYLNQLGIAQWTFDGVCLVNDTLDQSTPSMVNDMSGGVIVVWTDLRTNTERDIYAQRIDVTGTIQWQFNGVVVANKPIREHNEKVISDDAGGAIILWEQQDTSGIWDIWAQRINHAGNTLWTAGGIKICTVVANRLNPKVQKDGRGGAIITWQDLRNNVDYDIYAQRLDENGNRLWGNGGVSVCAMANSQLDPKIDPDSIIGGAYIAWVDKRNNIDYDIYAQRVDSMGNMLWTVNGVAVCTASGNQSAQDIISNNLTGGVICAWKDTRFGNYDIYTQKLNQLGAAQWTTDGIIISNAAYNQINPNIADDLAGGAIICWQDYNGFDYDIKSQHINTNGIIQWTAGGENICTSVGDQTSPKNTSDGNGGAIYAWQDKRSGVNDIYAHHLFANGSPNAVNQFEVSSLKFQVYPNPASEELRITNYELRIGDEIKIVNMIGETMRINTVVSSGNNSIAVHALPAGIYFTTVKSTDGVYTMKFVKE